MVQAALASKCVVSNRIALQGSSSLSTSSGESSGCVSTFSVFAVFLKYDGTALVPVAFLSFRLPRLVPPIWPPAVPSRQSGIWFLLQAEAPSTKLIKYGDRVSTLPPPQPAKYHAATQATHVHFLNCAVAGPAPRRRERGPSEGVPPRTAAQGAERPTQGGCGGWWRKRAPGMRGAMRLLRLECAPRWPLRRRGPAASRAKIGARPTCAAGCPSPRRERVSGCNRVRGARPALTLGGLPTVGGLS
eukprot:scaffold3647_cov417-Prasinococcus_capsulatus_cf.AAC.2